MLPTRIGHSQGYCCYNKELSDMSTSRYSIPDPVLALMPVFAVRARKSRNRKTFIPDNC